MANLELVNRIENIELERIGTPPVHVLIKVTGSVNRNGFQMPSLIIKSTTPDAQGSLTFFFAAEPPDGGNPGNPIPIVARRSQDNLRGVTKLVFVAATNQMESNL